MPKAEKAKKKTATAKVDKQIHPKSRKASQLAKTIHKEEKKQQRKDDLQSKMMILKEKVMWFKEEIDSEKEKYSLSEVSQIISKYLSRFQERLDEINEQNKFNKAHGRRGRYHAAEEEAIKMVNDSESELFTKGNFEAPDLTNALNVKNLRSWDGELKLLPNIKLRKFRRDANENAVENENMES